MPGGYVGVDIFFVISGYLITRQLLAEIETTGRIDLVSFWLRRFRRLLPNALLVLGTVGILAYVLLPEAQRVSVMRDIVFATVYSANYRFAGRTLDYFDHDVQTSPVLHFWSLAVEEQFYLIWPLLLLGLMLAGRRLLLVGLAGAVVLSFVASLALLADNPPRAFFGTEARLWQLGFGGVLAALPRLSVSFGIGSLAGTSGIAAGILLYNDRLAYPGWWALVPTIAAAAVIASPTRWLGTAPLTWVGKRSYSLYLWHWPALIFTPLLLPGTSTMLALPICLVAATLAFAWVEEPLRRGALPRVVFTFGVAGCAALVATAFTQQGGGNAELLARARSDGPRTVVCRVPAWGETDQQPCAFGATGSQHVVVLFGDSHAEHLFDGLNRAAFDEGWELRAWTKASCPPIDQNIFDPKMRMVDTACSQWRENIIRRLINEQPDLVVISSWTGVAGKMMDPVSGERLNRSDSLRLWREGFSRILGRLGAAGIKVVVVRDTPKAKGSTGSACLAERPEHECATPRAQALYRDAPDIAVAREIPGIGVLDLSDYFCGPRVCPAVNGGIVVYRGDNNHITATFSLTLAPAFRPLLRSTEGELQSIATGAVPVKVPEDN